MLDCAQNTKNLKKVTKDIKGKEGYQNSKEFSKNKSQPIEPEFSVIFAKIRRSLNLTQEVFAMELEIEVKTVHKYEYGDTDIPVYIYYKACALYNKYIEQEECILDKDCFELFDIFDKMDKMEFSKSLGKIIKYCRQKAGISQEKLDEKIGVGRCIQRYEAGKSTRTIGITRLKQIGEALGVNLVDILVNIRKIEGKTLRQLRELLENNTDV